MTEGRIKGPRGHLERGACPDHADGILCTGAAGKHCERDLRNNSSDEQVEKWSKENALVHCVERGRWKALEDSFGTCVNRLFGLF